MNSVVPNDLNDARLVYTIEEARHQIDDMVVISGENMTKAISEAEISPNERAYLYLKVQEKLRYDLNKVKGLVRTEVHFVHFSSDPRKRSIYECSEQCFCPSLLIFTIFSYLTLIEPLIDIQPECCVNVLG